MHGPPEYTEEGFQGGIRNIALLKRLLPYLWPYKSVVSFVLLLTFMSTGFELVLPYLSKVAIDRYILPSHYRVHRDPVPDARVAEVISSYGELLQEEGFVSKESLLKMDPADVHLLRERGWIGEDRYYRGNRDAAVEAALGEEGIPFLEWGPYLYVSYDMLSGVHSETLRKLREKDLRGIGRIALLFLFLLGISFALYYGSIYHLEWTSQKVMQDIRIEVFHHLLKQRVPFFDRNLVGKLVTRVTNDVQNLNELFKSVILAIFKDFFLVFGIMIVMLRLNRSLALICFSLMPIIAIITMLFARLSREAFREIRIRLAQLNSFLQENFNNISIIQYYVLEKYRLFKFREINAGNYKAGMKQIFVFAVFMPAIELVSSASIGMLIWYGGGKVIENHMSLGILVAFIGYIQLLFRPIRELSEKFNIMQSALASTERIFQVLDHKEFLDPIPNPYHPQEVHGHIEFRDVHFAYRPGEPVLNGISFEALPGQTIALVGATGAGKTSLIHLLERFYEPDKGAIYLDGVDIRDYEPALLRSSIGLVMQDVVLFAGSVLENITMGEETWDQAHVHVLMEKIRADRFIRNLPDGYDHEVGEGGAVLSAGERQLLAFARVLVYNPKVLVLDEATANVDPETEELIQEALRTVMHNRTTLVIAHRLSTVRNADKILVMGKGHIVEEGTHEELMRLGGLYYDLHRYQEET